MTSESQMEHTRVWNIAYFVIVSVCLYRVCLPVYLQTRPYAILAQVIRKSTYHSA